MSWFSSKKEKEKEEPQDKTAELGAKKEKEIQELLLSLALESYQSKNFTVGFTRDYDRKGIEFIPNLFNFERGKQSKFKDDKWKYINSGAPLVIINKNQTISHDWGHGAYLKGGLHFDIFILNEDGAVIKYSYNNVNYGRDYSKVQEKFDISVGLCDGNYHTWTTTPEDAFGRNWWTSHTRIEIHRMKKLEKLIQLMVDEQTIDQEARNVNKMDKFMSFMPKKSKREKILKELLKEY